MLSGCFEKEKDDAPPVLKGTQATLGLFLYKLRMGLITATPIPLGPP